MKQEFDFNGRTYAVELTVKAAPPMVRSLNANGNTNYAYLAVPADPSEPSVLDMVQWRGSGGPCWSSRMKIGTEIGELQAFDMPSILYSNSKGIPHVRANQLWVAQFEPGIFVHRIEPTHPHEKNSSTWSRRWNVGDYNALETSIDLVLGMENSPGHGTRIHVQGQNGRISKDPFYGLQSLTEERPLPKEPFHDAVPSTVFHGGFSADISAFGRFSND